MLGENTENFVVKRGSDRSFGLVFAVVFAIIGLFPLLYGRDLGLWRYAAIAIAVILLAFALIRPHMLSWLNYIWFRFGLLLGAIVAPIIMFLIFIFTVLPIGLLMRLFGKDLLSKKRDPNAKTYWIMRSEQPRSMKDQF